MTAAERKRAAAVYREAARLIESGKASFFCPPQVPGNLYLLAEKTIGESIYFDDFEEVVFCVNDKSLGERATFACFMAAIVEAGDA